MRYIKVYVSELLEAAKIHILKTVVCLLDTDHRVPVCENAARRWPSEKVG